MLPIDERPELPDTDSYRDVTSTEGSIPAPGADIPIVIYRPAESAGPAPALVLSVEAYGINEYMRRVAATLAHIGYVVVAVDYYRGEVLSEPDNYDDFTEVMGFIDRLDFVRGTHDVMAAIDHARALPGVDPDRVAVWGYCTGATLAMLAACLHPDLFAAVLFFPSQPTFPELTPLRPLQPIDLLWNATCPILLIYGDQDRAVSTEVQASIRERFEQWDVDHRMIVYPGADHAFSGPSADMRNDAADRASWKDALAFLDQQLGQ